jgi:hypothetical protein
MIIGSYFDGFDDVAQKLRLDLIPKYGPAGFGLNLVVMIADFTDPAIDDAFPVACKAAGLNVLLAPNTWDYTKLNTVFNANTNVIGWDCMDDADLAGITKTQERIATLKPHIKTGLKTYITVSKGSDHAVFGNLAEMYHIQNYHWREGLKQWSWTRMLDARKNCNGVLLHGPSLLKNTPLTFGLKSNRREFMIDGEYTNLAYNKASILAALCAGANGIIYYTLFNGIAELFGKDPTQKYYHCILERPDFVEGYKNFHNEVLRKYEVYFDKGTRVPFEIANTSIVGATFTLPTGEWIRIEVDTKEYDPTYRIIDSRDLVLQGLFKGPTPLPATAKVTIAPDTVTIKGSNLTFTP